MIQDRAEFQDEAGLARRRDQDVCPVSPYEEAIKAYRLPVTSEGWLRFSWKNSRPI